ncbi:MAG: prephenate dehydrogenase, partial [Anaerolineales bacterium]|nr:prephenate dehydrogenase [Anaerolineales bacterium]
SNATTREQLIAHHISDEASADLGCASAADLIVLAAPVRAIIETLPRVGEIARADAIVLDLGSTKREIIRAMENLPAPIQPIGAHPMCGKETSGFAAADAELYRGAVFILTPLARTAPETLAFAQSFAEVLGARPLVLDAERHDRIVAAISHLPFAVAAALMASALDLAREDDLLWTLAASGFRDTSRLAASDVTMMRDILLTNRDNVADALRVYAQHLNALANAISTRDETALNAFLETAATQRRAMFR